ncbi:galactokinase [Robertkochia sediminum]|uniref:galactokinase n=1 Tax=Robertkochia sediminum TaxID=2785326 RepID=UPI001932405C|nr:galactokinase [Robertkochia sediminum]MBL7473265.1 galactokinase [Robertkochia sediminum]
MKNNLLDKVGKHFSATFNATPQLVFSPGRINLIGEHVDYNDGFVFPAAIDKGIAVAIKESGTPESGICTAIALDLWEIFEFELVNLAPLKDGGWRNFVIGVVAEVIKAGGELQPFNIVFSGNVPSGSGLSSSAALENGIVYSLNALFDLGLTRGQMIMISQKAEHLYVGVQCGIMDQYASMFGEEDHFLLLDCRSLESKKFHIDLSGYTLVLLNTNVKHNLSDSTYNKRRALCEKVAGLLGKSSLREVTENELKGLRDKELSEDEYQKVLYVVQEIARTVKAGAVIEQGDVEALGNLLFETHSGLSKQYEVSCEELDSLVALAVNTPYVIGARMMGGGFGGCTINIVQEAHAEDFIAAARRSYVQQFGFECTPIHIKLSKGTHLIK